LTVLSDFDDGVAILGREPEETEEINSLKDGNEGSVFPLPV
jgi:hypothetical protein